MRQDQADALRTALQNWHRDQSGLLLAAAVQQVLADPPALAAAQEAPALSDADIVRKAEGWADIFTDSRGRKTYDFDSYGLVGFAREVISAAPLSATWEQEKLRPPSDES